MKKLSSIEKLDSNSRQLLEKIAEVILCENEDMDYEAEKYILKLCKTISYDQEMTSMMIEEVVSLHYEELEYDRKQALDNIDKIECIYERMDSGELTYEECKDVLDEFDSISECIADVDYYPSTLIKALYLWNAIYSTDDAEYDWKLQLDEKIRSVLRRYNTLMRYNFGNVKVDEKAKLDALMSKFLSNEKRYLVCGVQLFDVEKCYNYIADGLDVHVGDSVIVPIGKDNHEALGYVLEINCYSENQSPYPINKMKKIIRKQFI